ncbi:hypothetical protein, partial [Vibrio vulnificus]|uniref:hypothetical protein n=1 Tax=Vibrio vulnificus TaxID=672 RepID=UPI001F511A53
MHSRRIVVAVAIFGDDATVGVTLVCAHGDVGQIVDLTHIDVDGDGFSHATGGDRVAEAVGAMEVGI